MYLARFASRVGSPAPVSFHAASRYASKRSSLGHSLPAQRRAFASDGSPPSKLQELLKRVNSRSETVEKIEKIETFTTEPPIPVATASAGAQEKPTSFQSTASEAEELQASMALITAALERIELTTRTRAAPIKEQINSLRLRLKHGIVTNTAAKEELRQTVQRMSGAAGLGGTTVSGLPFFGGGGSSGGGGGGSGSALPGSKDSPLYMYQKATFGGLFISLLPALLLMGLLLVAMSGRSEGDLLGIKDEPQLASTPDETFASVIGDEEAKEDLSDIVQYLANPLKFTELKATLPKGVLLIGSPGCGKTLMARALAGEAGVPFLFTSGAEFEEMFVGVGARRVRKLFKRAKELAPCVIFIDEIDVIGASRDNHEYKSKYTLQQLLVEMDGFAKNSGVVVIAATNRPETLDPALTRSGRFDRKVYVSPPDVKARGDIIRLYLGDDKDTVAKEAVERLAKITTGFSGADLFNMVNSARIEAAKKGLPAINLELLNWAREMIAVGRERRSMVMTDLEKRICAFHEIGHALTALHTPGSHPVEKATIIPRGLALGMTVYEPKEDENLITREALLAQLVTAMGGRAAEELIFGPNQVTQGAGNDFSKATEIAQQMVMRYGMSDKIGHVVYERKGVHSERRQQEIDEEVRAIVETAYAQAKKILTTHSDQLHTVANALLEHETLTADEIGKLMTGQPLTLKPPKSVMKPDDPKGNAKNTSKPLLPNPARLRPAGATV